MSIAITAKRIGSVEELEKLAPIWKELQDSCAYQHVLMDHRWLSAWWRSFGAGKAQHTLLLSSGRTPVGIVPLAITRGLEAYPLRDPYVMGPDDYRFLPGLRWRRVAPLRRLTYPLNLISGNVRGQAIFPDQDQNLYNALAHYAASISGSWDVGVFPGIRPWEHEHTALNNAARGEGLSPGTRQATRPMLYIDLPSTFADFLKIRSSQFARRMRQEINRCERIFAQLGPMKVTRFRGPDIDEGMRRLLALEKKSWKVSDEKNRRLHLTLDETSTRFFKVVAHRFAADDEAQVLILSFGGTDAAGWFTLERRGVTSSVLTYRNEELHEPVAIYPVIQELIKSAIEHGLTRLDVNGYTRNYLKWAKDKHDFSQQLIFNANPYSRLLRLVDDGALALKRRLFPKSGEIITEPVGPSS